jgi:hypothetical protein
VRVDYRAPGRPGALIGTITLLLTLGNSINALTLFGLVPVIASRAWSGMSGIGMPPCVAARKPMSTPPFRPSPSRC